MIINFYIREEYYRELYYLAMRLAEDYHESSPNEAMYYYKNALLALYCYIKLNPLLTRESHLLYLEYTILRLDKLKKLMPIEEKEK